MRKYLSFRGIVGSGIGVEYLLPVSRMSKLEVENGGVGETVVKVRVEPDNDQFIQLTFQPDFDTEKVAFNNFLNDNIKELCKTGNQNVVKKIGNHDNYIIYFKGSTGTIIESVLTDVTRG